MRISQLKILPSPGRAGWLRLSAEVEYRTLKPAHDHYWFEVPQELASFLNLGGDPWLAAGLPLAAALGEPLTIEAPVDPALAEGAEEIIRVWTRWGLIPHPVPLRPQSTDPARTIASSRTASFFSGGVDSFFTLLHAREHPEPHGDPELAIFIHGFDIPLPQTGAYEASLANARAACEHLRVELIPVATNLRETSWHLADWERLAHGALLAACGHLLSPAIDTLLVPSGWVPRYLRPWGSHPDTDPLFSSTSVAIVHHAHHFSRKQKTRYLTSHPVALNHLRVCWKATDGGNCHRCYKCLRTMATLEVYRALADSSAFQKEKFDLSLFDDLDLGHLVEYFPELQATAERRGKHKVAAAIGRSVQHTRRLDRRPWRRALHSVKDWVKLRPRLRQRLERALSMLGR